MDEHGFLTADQSKLRRRAALVSVFAAVGLVLAKLAAGLLTNSLALFSEAGHSSVDLMAALVSYIAIRNAGRPPDREHMFGHAKFESMGALVELAFLFALGGVVVYNAFRRLLFGSQEITVTPVAIALIVLTVAVDVWRTVTLLRAAKSTGSEALTASAFHFLSDLLGTIVVVFGLIFAALGYHRADSIAALAVAALVFLLGFHLGRRVFHSLTDRAPSGVAQDVAGIVSGIRDVIDVHDIRVRQAGSQYFTEMHVHLSSDLSLERAHAVLDNIETELLRRYPGMHVVTHPEPFDTTTGSPATAE